MSDDTYQFIQFKNYNVPKNIHNHLDFIQNNEFELINNQNLIPFDLSKKQIFIFSLDIYLNNIRKSFTKSNIQKQVQVDLTRLSLYINGHKIDDYKLLNDYISEKFKDRIDNIMMLFTQATMGKPFEVICSHFFLYNYYVADIKNVDDKIFNIFMLTDKDDNIKFIIEKNMQAFQLDNRSNICNNIDVLIKVEFTLDDDYMLITYQIGRVILPRTL